MGFIKKIITFGGHHLVSSTTNSARARHQWIQELHGRRKPCGQDVQQHPTAQGQAPGHVLGAAQGRVGDEAVPAHGGAGLLHVGPGSFLSEKMGRTSD